MDRLTQVKDQADSVVVADYEYDALNRRRRKNVNGGADTLHVYDGWKVIEERTGTNAIKRRYIYGNNIDEILMMEVDENTAGDIDGDGLATEVHTFYYSTNVQGDVTHITLGTANFLRAAGGGINLALGAVVELFHLMSTLSVPVSTV